MNNLKEYVNEANKYFDALKLDKLAMDSFFIKAGIYDKDGNLTENYKIKDKING